MTKIALTTHDARTLEHAGIIRTETANGGIVPLVAVKRGRLGEVIVIASSGKRFRVTHDDDGHYILTEKKGKR